MLIFLLLVSVVYGIYLLGMVWARWVWTAGKPVPVNPTAPVYFSILIPARNEDDRIGFCLESLKALNYADDLFEIIVIDDHSTDDTAARVRSFQEDLPNLRLLRLSDYLTDADRLLQAFKKKAIEMGIQQSKGSWIVTTDADCRVPANWLRSMAAAIRQEQAAVLVMPVKMIANNKSSNKLLRFFQQLDFLSLQGITGTGIRSKTFYLSNGANFAYEKTLFRQVNGFEGADDMASGDDLLLLHKFRFHTKARIVYLQSADAIVSTPVEPDLTSFIRQRRRWAGKSNRYIDKKILPVMLLVFAVNALVAVAALLHFLHPTALCMKWFCLSYGKLALGMFLVKTSVELYLLWPVARFFQQQSLLLYFPLMQPLHILYTLFMAIAGQSRHHEWKGRRVR
jgi:cellulose synthase/poly-beta-1,6-N-acetylglucosamine synthase-like glycosyltransferase